MSAPRHPALRYPGGKFRLARWISQHFPPHMTYVEPFGGAAGVMLRKDPSPVEVYNDLDGAVVNFFRVLRERRRELLQAVKNTPFSRAEFDASFVIDSPDPVENARRYFVQAWQSYGGPRFSKRTGWKYQNALWQRQKQMIDLWNQSIRNLAVVADRLRSVQIESDDFLRVIARYDTPETLFYCDPPYPADTRNQDWMKTMYRLEFSSADHLHLANSLKRIKGLALVSTYPNEHYNELFAGWPSVTTTCQTMNKTIATEQLFISPRAYELLELPATSEAA